LALSLRVSIVICTRNRAASLARTLESLARLIIPTDLVCELVVIDNGSTDATQGVIAGFRDRLRIRSEHERVAGLAQARNRGVEVATGDYIIWTDDDVVVDPAWLDAYVTAFRQWPDAAVFGGKIIPRLEAPTPAWFAAAQSELGSLLAHRDFGDDPLPLAIGEGILPFGANYAVRAAEQRRFRYDTALGVAPGRMRLGEETAVIEAILTNGGAGYWTPCAKVFHCISCDRQSVSYIQRYFAAQGETHAYLGEMKGAVKFAGAPRWLWRQLVVSYLHYRIARVWSEPAIWCRALRRHAFFWGAFRFLVFDAGGRGGGSDR